MGSTVPMDVVHEAAHVAQLCPTQGSRAATKTRTRLFWLSTLTLNFDSLLLVNKRALERETRHLGSEFGED